MKVMQILKQTTYALQHNPNCPEPYLVRLPGNSAVIDLKNYHETRDILGSGKTLREAAHKALRQKEVLQSSR